ncbi:hypothetical protein [Nocardia sp. NPDC127526]|uniref:hypothetical protein n=1 Tax=Nocardia sp. NPDC127526 TaxID=3345393 RepID=UPI00363BA670
MSHEGKGRYAGLEGEDRDKMIRGLRDLGEGYRQIADRLGLTARQVEIVLGEVARLHTAGHSDGEIGRRVGLPRSTVQRLRGGASVSNTRKSTALTALSEQGGMQLDVLGWFLGMDKSHTYVLVKQLRDDHLVRKLEQIQPGEKWVITNKGTASRFLGWSVKEWRTSLKQAAHHRAVAQARIMLVGDDLEAWISERALQHRAELAANETHSRKKEFSTGRAPREGLPHIHDGRFLGQVQGLYGWWALEVELSRKADDALDTALRGAIRAARDATPEKVVGLLYLCRTAGVMDGVNAAAERLPPEVKAIDIGFAVRDFDDIWHDFLTRRAAKPRRRNPIHASKDQS